MSKTSRTAQIAALCIQALILYSIVTMSLETMPELSVFQTFFRISEAVVVVIFSIEYVFRWSQCANRLRYPFTFMAVVDLLAIAPFFFSLGFDLRGLRALRLLRITRILKMGRYSRALQTLSEATRRAGPELVAAAFIVGILILISAMGIYYAERDAQPDVFSSIPATLWWAVVTLTTVGYGDAYPVTPLGKIIASVVMIAGVGVIAVPTGILSSTFTDVVREQRAKGEASPRE